MSIQKFQRAHCHFKELSANIVVLVVILSMFSPQLTPEDADGLTANAGGPYEANEGEPITFDASESVGRNGASLQYRWDFDGDGAWDTPFVDSPIAMNTWSDDYSGKAFVEVRSTSGPKSIEIIGNLLPGGGWVIGMEKRAQSFVATIETATEISVDVSLNRNEVPNAPLVLAIRSDLNGSDMTAAEVEGAGMPVEAENWVMFDVPDIALVPGDTYYVVLYSNATNAPYQPHVTYDTYPNGTAWGVGGGGAWQETPSVDMRMRIFGGGGQTHDIDDTTVTVHNLPPIIDAVPSRITIIEGDSLNLSATATDPGCDNLSFTWSWERGPTDISTQMNDGSYPFVASDSSSHTYGDDGTYVVNLTVEDDDGGAISKEIIVTVTNVAPSLSLNIVSSGDEGESLDFQVGATDSGSDDISYSWWGHCNGWSATSIVYPNDPAAFPDPHLSPEVNPRNVTDTQTVVCGDDGTFLFEVQVEDDDGGLTTLKGTFQVGNIPPSLSISPPSILQIHEGTSVKLDAVAADPGSDDLSFTWTWDYGPSETRRYFNDGLGPDSPSSPDGTYPFTASDSSTHTYGDNCLCNVTLRVEDDDGGFVVYTTLIEVFNLPPVQTADIRAYAEGDLTLRVAGERWHDVVVRLYDDGIEIAGASVFRTPGSPDEQSATIEDVVIDLLNDNFSAVVEYTPMDDPINGQVNGASPAWLVFTPYDGGEESYLHHTFNVKHPDTWLWRVVDFNAFLLGVSITFESMSSDHGSDDLTFTWDWGDGTSTTTTYYNDGIGPDTHPSPDVNPITVTDYQKHAFRTSGVYTVVLIVEDDDGGSVVSSSDLSI